MCVLTCSVRCRSCCWRSRSSRSTSTLATSTRHASTQTSTRRRSLLGTFPAPPCRYDNLDEDDHEAEDDGHAFSAGDAFIHQGVCALAAESRRTQHTLTWGSLRPPLGPLGIHTIEFVLGGISNTAPCHPPDIPTHDSYMNMKQRLSGSPGVVPPPVGALARALAAGGALQGHDPRRSACPPAPQTRREPTPLTLRTGAGLKSGIENPALAAVATFIAFSMWAIISLIVLMAMENLSSFLHALRLQWVEFQNKFYYGDGQKWSPFAFAAIGSGAED